MEKNELDAWIRGREEEAARRLLALAGKPMDALESENRFMELADLWSGLHGWPGPRDRVREHGVEVLRARWTRIHAIFAAR